MAHEFGERIIATLQRYPARQAHLAELLWVPLDSVSGRLCQLEREGRVRYLADGRWAVTTGNPDAPLWRAAARPAAKTGALAVIY
jgi:DNA-binding IclR family transcriptional regulator